MSAGGQLLPVLKSLRQRCEINSAKKMFTILMLWSPTGAQAGNRTDIVQLEKPPKNVLYLWPSLIDPASTDTDRYWQYHQEKRLEIIRDNHLIIGNNLDNGLIMLSYQ